MPQMESTYEVIKRIENNMDFTILLKKGIIPLSVLSKKCYYERYLQERLQTSKMQSITNTSEEFRISQKTVYNAIKFMRE